MRRVSITGGSSATGRCRGDRGQVGGIEVLPFGFLVFVGAVMLFANVWGVVDAKFAVSAAAREGARAFAESDDPFTATVLASTRAHETLAAFGRDGTRAAVDPPRLIDGFGRCRRVQVTVRYDLPALAVPFLGGLGSLTPVAATHTEVIDPFRNGPAGEATC